MEIRGNQTENKTLNRLFPALGSEEEDDSVIDPDPLEDVTYPESPVTHIFVPPKPKTQSDLDKMVQNLVTSSFFAELEKEIEELDSEYGEEEPGPPVPSLKPMTTVEELTKKTEAENPEAMFELAKLYHKGIRVSQDLEKATELYQAAIQKGHTKSLSALGNLKLECDDIVTAASLFLSASEQGDTEAFYHLGRMYEQGHPLKKDYTKAFEYTLKAAASGDPRAVNHLGLMQLKGHGTPKNYEQAIDNFIKAIHQDNVDAMNNYAHMHHMGWGIDADFEKARMWYEQASGRGSAAAYYHLGLMHERGEGGEADWKAAKECFLGAAGLGSRPAMNHIGCLYRDSGQSELALEWLRKGMERGHPEATYHLGNLLLADNFEEGMKYLNLAVELGYPVKKKTFSQEGSCLYWS